MVNLVENWEIIPPKGLAVYIHYTEFVPEFCKPATERETLGWLTHKAEDFVCIEHDRTIENLQRPSGSGNGIILQKGCILEIRDIICKSRGREENGSTSRKHCLKSGLRGEGI